MRILWLVLKALVAKAWAAVNLTDSLVVGGTLVAISGSVTLFGWPVTRLAFGAAAMVAGVALVVYQSCRGRTR